MSSHADNAQAGKGTGKGKKGIPPMPPIVLGPKASSKGRLSDSEKTKQRLLLDGQKQALISMFRAEEAWEDAKRELLSRLVTLRSADIHHVPWDRARMFVSIKVNRVCLIEFEGGSAIILRSVRSSATTFVADRVAETLHLKPALVPRMRYVHPGEEEHEAIKDVQARLGRPCGPKHARIAAEFAESEDKSFELLEDSVAVMEFADAAVTLNQLPLQKLQSIAASPQKRENFLKGLGKLFVLDTILLNNDRLPNPVFPKGHSHFNETNLMVMPESGDMVGIDCEVNGCLLPCEDMEKCRHRVRTIGRQFLSDSLDVGERMENGTVDVIDERQSFTADAVCRDLLGAFDMFKTFDTVVPANSLLTNSIRDGFRNVQETWHSKKFHKLLDKCLADSIQISAEIKGYGGPNFATDVAYLVECVKGRGAAVAMCNDVATCDGL